MRERFNNQDGCSTAFSWSKLNWMTGKRLLGPSSASTCAASWCMKANYAAGSNSTGRRGRARQRRDTSRKGGAHKDLEPSFQNRSRAPLFSFKFYVNIPVWVSQVWCPEALAVPAWPSDHFSHEGDEVLNQLLPKGRSTASTLQFGKDSVPLQRRPWLTGGSAQRSPTNLEVAIH